ncbi:MAG: cupin domain-containing protein [Balneolales bacterium]
MPDHSRIVRSVDFTWPDLKQKKYKEQNTGFKDISRFILLGEEEDDRELTIQTRYFEIANQGYSSIERHRHTHTVIIVKGKGSMILGNRIINLDFMDTIYVAPNTVHQFHADRGEPLGFLCIVNRDRDRPEIPYDEKTLESWLPDPEIRRKAKI